MQDIYFCAFMATILMKKVGPKPEKCNPYLMSLKTILAAKNWKAIGEMLLSMFIIDLQSNPLRHC